MLDVLSTTIPMGKIELPYARVARLAIHTLKILLTKVVEAFDFLTHFAIKELSSDEWLDFGGC